MGGWDELYKRYDSRNGYDMMIMSILPTLTQILGLSDKINPNLRLFNYINTPINGGSITLYIDKVKTRKIFNKSIY